MSGIKKVFISCFILFNFMVMMRIHLPMNKEFFSTIYRPVDSYLSYFSLFQSWSMFSPNPAKTNVHLSAVIEFHDGSKDTYLFPDASKMTLADKYSHGERFRVISEAIRRDANKFLWHDAAKFAMRKLRDKNYHKIPLKVELYRHWDTIPEISKNFRPHLTKARNYEKYNFYTYEVL